MVKGSGPRLWGCALRSALAREEAEAPTWAPHLERQRRSSQLKSLKSDFDNDGDRALKNDPRWRLRAERLENVRLHLIRGCELRAN